MDFRSSGDHRFVFVTTVTIKRFHVCVGMVAADLQGPGRARTKARLDLAEAQRHGRRLSAGRRLRAAQDRRPSPSSQGCRERDRRGGGRGAAAGDGRLDQKQQEKIIARFNADRDDEYKEFIEKCIAFEAEIAEETRVKHFTFAELEENEQELTKFKTWIAKIQKLDFYKAQRAEEAAERLTRSEAILDAYAHNVFAAQDENKPSDNGKLG